MRKLLNEYIRLHLIRFFWLFSFVLFLFWVFVVFFLVGGGVVKGGLKIITVVWEEKISNTLYKFPTMKYMKNT